MTTPHKQFGDGTNGNSGFSCGQIEVERNHDHLHIRPTLKSSRDTVTSKGLSLDTYYRDLDRSHTHCKNFAYTNSPQWTDLGFVNFIFQTNNNNTSKQELWDRGLNAPHKSKYLGQAWVAGNKLGHKLCDGNIYSFQNLSANTTKSRQDLIGAIRHHSGPIGAYMFVDVGKWILDILNEVSTTTDPIFHIINSQASLGDSATEGKDLYDNAFFKKKLFCWWYMEDLFVPSYNITGQQPSIPYNYMYHSGYECWMGDAGAANPGCMLIKQWWYEKGNYGANYSNYLYMSDNARYHNNKTYINAEFDKLAKNGNANDDLYSLCYHRKRSGDGFAMWFMEQFATILAQPQGDDLFYPCCAHGINDPFGDPPNVPTNYSLMNVLSNGATTKIRIRKKSYFITGDWAAFCWAAYCHCNVIFQCSGHGGWAIMFVADNTKVCY